MIKQNTLFLPIKVSLYMKMFCKLENNNFPCPYAKKIFSTSDLQLGWIFWTIIHEIKIFTAVIWIINNPRDNERIT